MEHYVTLFDSLFLPQGLALHASMERHTGAYTLWILCMDDETFRLLQRFDLPNVRLLKITTLETKELKQVKPLRTRAEYCWTITPFTPRFVFEEDSSVKRVTYIDADMWMRKNPTPIFRELEASGKQVLLTDHAYAPEYDQSTTSGQYCVQFMTFNRGGSELVRKWWEDRCIEWCYARHEDGKFGDQKYLDDWPERFPGEVHVLENKELILAPWNSLRYPFGNSCLYHFHGLRLAKNGNEMRAVMVEPYTIPERTVECVYKIYLEDLMSALISLSDEKVPIMSQCQIEFKDNNRTRLGVFKYFSRRSMGKKKNTEDVTDKMSYWRFHI